MTAKGRAKRARAGGRRGCAIASGLLLAVFAAAAVAQGGPFELARDLEASRPGRPAYGGWAWNLAGGRVLVAGDSLWRVGEPGEAPEPILRGVLPEQVHHVDGEELVVYGRTIAGEEGLWVTDGGPPRRLAPEGFRLLYAEPTTRIARHGATFVAKTDFYAHGGGIWRLSESTPPTRIGPALMVDHSGMGLWQCTAVYRAPKGFVDCGSDWEKGVFGLRFGDGGGGFEMAPEFPYVIDSGAIMYNNSLWLSGSNISTGEPIVLRTDGTREGTVVVGPGAAPFPFLGGLGWLADSGATWVIWRTAATGPPEIVLTGGPPYEPQLSRPIADDLYLHSILNLPSPRSEIWVLPEGDSLEPVAELGGSISGELVGSGFGSEALFFVRAPNFAGTELWRTSKSGETERLTEPRWGWSASGAIRLPEVSADLPLPFVDAFGDARPAQLGPGGSIEPLELLVLPGTAGSAATVLGTFEGQALLFAETSLEGPSFWLSDGTAGGTQPLGLDSSCSRHLQPRPRFEPPNLLVDCLKPDLTATVWLLGGDDPLMATIDFGASIHWLSPPPRVVPLGDKLVFTQCCGQGTVGLDLATGVTTVLVPGCRAEPVRAGNRVLLACQGSTVWSTDGSVAGTFPLLTDLPDTYRRTVVEVGDRALLPGTPTWITDGTAAGSAAIESVVGAAPAPSGSAWTCAWTQETLLRLDLPSAKQTSLADLGPPIIASRVFDAGGSIKVLSLLDETHASHLWRCDGTISGSMQLPAPSEHDGIYLVESWANDDHHVWRHLVDDRSERVERLRYGAPAWDRVVDLPRPFNDDRLGDIAFRYAGGRLWTTLADEAHGREPWVLAHSSGLSPIFADGFESGTTAGWSSGAP